VYNVVFEKNVFYEIGRINTGCDQCGKHDHGLYLRGREFVVNDNTFYNFRAGWPISVRGHYGDAGSRPTHIISKNIFAYDYNPDPDHEGHINLYVNPGDKPMSNVIIEENVFYKPDGSNTIVVGAKTQAGDVYFRDNKSSNSGYAYVPGTSSINLIKSNNTMGSNFTLTISTSSSSTSASSPIPPAPMSLKVIQ
jgi:hypothetical protein